MYCVLETNNKIKFKKTSIDEDVEKRELSYPVGRIANWYSHYGKQFHISKN